MSNKVVLLLEDEALIAIDVEETLTEACYSVVSINNCAEAESWLKENPPPAVAIVDVELNDGSCDIVARELTSLSVPFVVHSGALSGPDDLGSEDFTAGVWLSKPSLTADLVAAVETAVSSKSRS